MLLPAFVFIALFSLYPAARSFYLSFYEQLPFVGTLEFVGWQNYRNMFTGFFAEDYLRSLRVTGWFTLFTVLPTVFIGLFVALALNQDVKGIGAYRTFAFVTVAVSTAVAAVAWKWMFNTQVGYVNYLLGLVGVPKIAWLTSPDTALLAVSIMTVWQSLGFTAVLLLAGLQGIDKSFYEAASLDGANRWHRFVRVTIPLLSPALFLVLILTLTNNLTAFGQVDVMTSGGPNGHTSVVVYQLYKDAFQNFRPGFASAQAVVLFVGLSLITVVQFVGLGRRVHYG